MSTKTTLIASICSLAFAMAVPAHADNDAPENRNPESTSDQANSERQPQKSPAERRAEIRATTKQTLQEVYAKYPESKAQIAKAAGYAVFRTGGVQVVFAGAGGGEGVAIRHGKETFMTVAQLKAGLGVGVKESRLLLVFTTDQAFNKFIHSGWAFSGDATAAAKAGQTGGSVTGAALIAPSVYAYQFTENGLTAEVTVAGTKYSVDKTLNAGK